MTSSSDTVKCLLCDGCNAPLCTSDDILRDKIPALSEAVYSYELDVLGEDIWVYSATNPSARRFDVARCNARVANDLGLIRCKRSFSPEYSWFPSYDWCMAECATCGRHLGWGFATAAANDDAGRSDRSENEKRSRSDDDSTANEASSSSADDESDDDNSDSTDDAGSQLENDGSGAVSVGASPQRSLAFLGIILTHCKARENYAAAKYEAEVSAIAVRIEEQREFHQLMRRLFQVLPRMRNQLLANQLGMGLLTMGHDGRLVVLRQLVAAAEGALQLEEATAAVDASSPTIGNAPGEEVEAALPHDDGDEESAEDTDVSSARSDADHGDN